MSNLDYLANVSLADYLTPFSLWFLTVDSACTSKEDIFLLLHSLLSVFRKTFLLIYNHSARNYFSIHSYKTTRTSDDLNTNNNLSFDSYTTTRTSDDFYNNNNYITMAIPVVLGKWSRLEDIYFRFGEHYNPELVWINNALDITYGSNLPDYNIIFEDDKARSKLKSNAIQLIKDTIIATILPIATDTDDVALVTPIINAMPLYTKSHSGQCLLLRSLENLTAALNIAIDRGPSQRIVTIYLDLGVLQFQVGMNPRNFADISQSPFPVLPPPNTPAPTAPAPAGGTLATPHWY